jgi:hypothetical protein
LHLPNDLRCRASFHVLVSHSYILSGELFILLLYPFISWGVCFVGEFYEFFILDSRSFSYIWVAYYFFHFISYLFIFISNNPWYTKVFLILIMFNIFIMFYFCVSGFIHSNPLPNPRSFNTMKYYLPIKRNEVQIYSTIWIKLQNVMLSKRSQSIYPYVFF